MPSLHIRQSAPAEIPAPEDKIELLRRIEIFRDLSEPEAEAMLTNAPMKTVPRGTRFYEAHDGPEALFFPKSGRVELFRRGADGRRLTLAIVGDGAFFGEMSLTGQGLPDTHAVAVEDCIVCSLNPADVGSLITSQPRVALRLIEELAGRLRQTRDALHEMAFNDVTGRVAALLLRLADVETGVVDGHSHRDLAATVGCLRESLTAVLDRFKGSGALEIGRRRIEIIDRSQLERVVGQRSTAPW